MSDKVSDFIDEMLQDAQHMTDNAIRREQWLNSLQGGDVITFKVRHNYARGHEVIDGTVSPIPKEIET